MIASISVIESNGKLATPTAILECFPISPNISKNKSEAGLITLGCAVNSVPEFTAQPKVINPASDLFFEIFGDIGKHSRIAVGVASLPLDSMTEIDAIIEISE